ncbi:oligosaccharide flippase family protein [Phascolarctobacterium sp.]|uniref:putative polysaccharide biosynthesis protein n=1 Tax=Phascolarctobacterium sp. TaxID=2049039 RepID=UPI00386EFD34
MGKDKFLRGAMILTLAGLMVKIIGSVNRILLSRLLGGEGIGLYQMAYPVYLLLLAISSAGIPVAISIIVSGYLAKQDYGNVRRVFHLSLAVMASLGLVLALLLVAGAGWLVDTGVIRDGRAYYALVALAPAVFFGTVLASFRGLFQGHQLMTPPAVSQILEQFIRVVTMIVLAYVLLPYGLEYAAAGAAFGAVPGSLLGMVVLGCFYHHYRKIWRQQYGDLQPREQLERGALVKRLLFLALPVSCANVLVPVTNSIDVLLVPGCLISSGLTVEQATTQFGYLAGMAQPLLLLATIPTISLATSLVPAISEAHALGKWDVIENKAATAVKLCCLLTLPAAVGMGVLAEPISRLLYGTGKAGVAMLHSAPALWFLGMHQVTTGVLQGMGYSALPMVHMLIGIGAKLAVLSPLTAGEYGIVGAAWATNINFGVTALLNILALGYYKITFRWYNIIRIMVAAALMGAVAVNVYAAAAVLGNVVAVVLAMAVAAAAYVLLLLLLGAVSKDELRHLPLVKKFCK